MGMSADLAASSIVVPSGTDTRFPFIFRSIICLSFPYGLEFTRLKTGAALYTEIRVDPVGLFLLAAYCAGRDIPSYKLRSPCKTLRV